jgi:hypothetical protein
VSFWGVYRRRRGSRGEAEPADIKAQLRS